MTSVEVHLPLGSSFARFAVYRLPTGSVCDFKDRVDTRLTFCAAPVYHLTQNNNPDRISIRPFLMHQ